ncbi:hypothetical protein EXW69_00980 [Francisella tularensis subsp. mediasiatica]|nr:hypothetical protein EXW67_00650 [Francisella tularensis subsp. mediasiatica]RZP38855.1 hypothetical protein EXW69_00980 [Francisella tularensis subsp. mediasiatica]RZP44110.1 hypothetical protein EXW68_00650 [Francisella tularensis subsp. mediasiatica]
MYVYNVVKFGCQERPEISSVEEPTKPLAIQDKKTKDNVITFWRQKLTYVGCGEERSVTLHYFIYNNENPKKVYYSIKAKNDPIPLNKTIFEGSFASLVLRNDVLNDVVRFLYSKKCSMPEDKLRDHIKYYTASALRYALILSNQKRIKVPQWQEVWSVDACDKNYHFPITFTGDGVGGTYWSIGKVTDTEITKS